MPAGQDDGDARDPRLDAFRKKLASLTDLELVTLSEMARRGTVNLEAEWELIVKQRALRDAERIKKKHTD